MAYNECLYGDPNQGQNPEREKFRPGNKEGLGKAQKI